MIYAAGGGFEARIISRQKQTPNPYNTRILSLYKAYKGTNLCEFWMQEQGAAVTAFLSRYAGNAVLDICPGADAEELCGFLKMAGFRSALYDGAFDLKPAAASAAGGKTMCFVKNGVSQPMLPLQPEAPGLGELHNLLRDCAGEGFHPPDYESFLLDMSHMTRHGCADIIALRGSGTLTSCALSLYQCDNAAVLGGVCCAPDKRRRGFGSQAVLMLIGKLQREGRTNLFLHCSSRETERFYERLGFKACGSWREHTR